MLTLLVVLFVLWLLGFGTRIVGDAIHILLVLFIIGAVWEFINRRSRTTVTTRTYRDDDPLV